MTIIYQKCGSSVVMYTLVLNTTQFYRCAVCCGVLLPVQVVYAESCALVVQTCFVLRTGPCRCDSGRLCDKGWTQVVQFQCYLPVYLCGSGCRRLLGNSSAGQLLDCHTYLIPCTCVSGLKKPVPFCVQHIGVSHGVNNSAFGPTRVFGLIHIYLCIFFLYSMAPVGAFW